MSERISARLNASWTVGGSRDGSATICFTDTDGKEKVVCTVIAPKVPDSEALAKHITLVHNASIA